MKPTMPLKEFNNLFVVEYSITQKATNVVTVTEMLNKNRTNLVRGSSLDYVPVAFAASHEDASKFAQRLCEHLEQLAHLDNQTTKTQEDLRFLLGSAEDRLWGILMEKGKSEAE